MFSNCPMNSFLKIILFCVIHWNLSCRNILLNNETLTLLNDNVPEIKPVILNNTEGLAINIPSASIGFWVLPDLKVC